MGATTIFFDGRVIGRPGSYSRVDASGLEQVGLGAAGIVAVLGTAEGGIPASEIESLNDWIRVKKPGAEARYFRSGDLKEVCSLLFAPSGDADIPGGAQEIVCMKVNPATQAIAQLSNASGPALDLQSTDYGAFTEQISIEVADGTTKGKLLTITFEDVTEAIDDLAGDAIMSLQYSSPAGGWTTMAVQVEAGGLVRASGTRDQAGLDAHVTPLAAADTIEVVSAAAGDVGQRVTVYGLDGAGAAIKETLVLNGTSAVTGALTFDTAKVLGMEVTGTVAGDVSVRRSTGSTVIMTATAGADPVRGMTRMPTGYAAGSMTVVADAASTADVILVGKSATGAAQIEVLTLNDTTPVPGTAAWSEITGLVAGDVAAARTVTLSGTAALAQPSVQSTIRKVVDYFNARSTVISAVLRGFIAAVQTSTPTMPTTALDVMPAPVDCLAAANPSLYADLYTIARWITLSSQFLDATIVSGAVGGAPLNTTAPVFLSGGSEGAASFGDWQHALNLLKQARINTIVPLTGDPAVHAAVEAHCAYMGGAGRSERDAVVGALNAGLDGLPTKAEIKAQILDLNSRHVRLIGQAVERFNSEGERVEWPPPFAAAIIAGMQAGSPVGTSLTFKYANILGFKQHTGWNPTDDAEEMISSGLCFFEDVPSVGRRVTRNITTHLMSSNIAFTEASVNEAANFAAYEFRTGMEFAVGKRGFSGTINASKGIAVNLLGILVDDAILVDWRSLDLELAVDVLEVGVEMAPIIPINFVKSTIHLVTLRQTA